ncbi:hypothetical protein OESDEN_08846 [Oesophagostomum dentatum]|uniref:Uncharacterized protein n=1 Tax=Oesophagostomum dentatum TaxID=61180 RepID=A0A0B1T668_OESDE|nr:hypothetical protein OESDEN_08846 [Oesophagostomum dentatum]
MAPHEQHTQKVSDVVLKEELQIEEQSKILQSLLIFGLLVKKSQSITAASGNAVLLRAFASTSSTSPDRSRAIGCVAAGLAVGLVIGPGLQALFTPLGEDGVRIMFGWSLTMYKAPALLAAIINILGILLMGFAFDEQYAGLKDDSESEPLPPADLVAVAVCIATRFTQLSTTANIETKFIQVRFRLLNADVRFFGTAGSHRQRYVSGCARDSGSVYTSAIHLLGHRQALKATYGEHRVHTGSPCISSDHLSLRFREFFRDSASASQVFAPKVCDFTDFSDLDSPNGGCDASRFTWCSATPKVNKWLYYGSLCMMFEVSFAVSNVVLPTLFSKVIGPRRQVGKLFMTFVLKHWF